MLRYLLILFAFIIIVPVSFSQDTLVLQGYYCGKNIYILNPSNGSDTSFCVNKVIINGKQSKDELHSNSFEIDFSLMSINNGDPVKILVIHSKNCKPKIVNPGAILPQSTFAFVTYKIDKAGKITWTVKGDIYSSFIIEQYRWQKWITAGEVDVSDTIRKNNYAFEIKPYFGSDEFRISQTDDKGNIIYTKSIKYHSPTKELFLTYTRSTEEITFTGETAYEIFDLSGNFISDGYTATVNVNDLPKGRYWINYDNKTEEIFKK